MKIDICVYNHDMSLIEEFPVTEVAIMNANTGVREITYDALLFRTRRHGLLPPQVGKLYWVLEGPNGALIAHELASQLHVNSCVQTSQLLAAWMRGESGGQEGAAANAAYSILLIRALPGTEPFDASTGMFDSPAPDNLIFR